MNFKKNKFSPGWLAFIIFGAIVWLASLCMLVWTANYDNDLKATRFLGQAFDVPFLNFISGYFIRDAYFTLASFLIPQVFLVLEAFLIAMKQSGSRKKGLNFFYRHRRVFEFTAAGIYTVLLPVLAYFLILADSTGFGPLFYRENFQGRAFSIFTYCMTLINNLTIFWTFTYIVLYRLANKPDFLAQGYWRRSCYFFIFTINLYLIVAILKLGFQRPLYGQIYFGDYLEKLKVDDFKRWEHYVSQNKFHYGWEVKDSHLRLGKPEVYINDATQNIPGQYPWWKATQLGWFFTGTPIKGTFTKNGAFPSGHLCTTLDIMIGIWTYTMPKRKTKSLKVIQPLGWVFGIGYNVIMFLALGFIYSHWMSDMVFTYVAAAFVFVSAYYITKGINNLFSQWVGKVEKRAVQQNA